MESLNVTYYQRIILWGQVGNYEAPNLNETAVFLRLIEKLRLTDQETLDTEFVASYVAEALAARELLRAGLDKLGIAYAPSYANFILGFFGSRAVEVRDALRDKAILVRDRSYEIPGGVRITAGTRAQAQTVLDELERIW